MNEQEHQTLRDEIRALPDLDPPPGLGDRVMAISAERQARTGSKAPLALAACLVAAVALSVLVVNRSDREGDMGQQVLAAQASVADLIAESQRLEERLRSMPLHGAYGDTGRVLAYRIADVDGALNAMYLQDMDASDERARLLHQRVVLLQSLVEVESQDRGAAIYRAAF
ncbi:MAG: hypothetical protein OXH52_22440 [Gammaproteobacteria bacterium]|nr:hypothetical protein [Gammaproteobacteria bacterium]